MNGHGLTSLQKNRGDGSKAVPRRHSPTSKCREFHCQHPESCPKANTTWVGAQKGAGNTGELLYAQQTAAVESREGRQPQLCSHGAELEGPHHPAGQGWPQPAPARCSLGWVTGTGTTSVIALPLVLTSFQQQRLQPLQPAAPLPAPLLAAGD